ncbi:MAG: hypothetical protein COB02_08115 [Candidatus Cloacimonadota bacterium]|nr:MAG: hypothetical protein COB02_08115 [Candidatus Cloacimonadota bacterium]
MQKNRFIKLMNKYKIDIFIFIISFLLIYNLPFVYSQMVIGIIFFIRYSFFGVIVQLLLITIFIYNLNFIKLDLFNKPLIIKEITFKELKKNYPKLSINPLLDDLTISLNQTINSFDQLLKVLNKIGFYTKVNLNIFSNGENYSPFVIFLSSKINLLNIKEITKLQIKDKFLKKNYSPIKAVLFDSGLLFLFSNNSLTIKYPSPEETFVLNRKQIKSVELFWVMPGIPDMVPVIDITDIDNNQLFSGFLSDNGNYQYIVEYVQKWAIFGIR